MFEAGNNGRRSVLMWAAKTALAIGFLSFCASYWLAGPALDNGTLARLASATSLGSNDPTTTGSILRTAAATTLDPCTGRQRP
ncbi:hypothetical protein [Enterovirga sp. CN4-39]|uniref:hypothetical protein n=1 Tax=Enterovirga sp. CN4-39 TaxID=3400910 RepID=UPI003C033AB0